MIIQDFLSLAYMRSNLIAIVKSIKVLIASILLPLLRQKRSEKIYCSIVIDYQIHCRVSKIVDYLKTLYHIQNIANTILTYAFYNLLNILTSYLLSFLPVFDFGYKEP